MKLDFHKAFDCVNWDSLDRVLCYRGFPNKWCIWIQNLPRTGKTAVLLNCVPGKWINCRNGLRQGDPLSPYLFIIIADILRRLLHHPQLANAIKHPLIPDAPCAVLQYTDDTLLFLKCSPEAINQTKCILKLFEEAAGLSINYHKTNFLPIGVPPDTALTLATTFGTTVSSFPQTYRLLLSPHKISVTDCLPLISSCDKYLSGWQASLLNRAGKLTLTTSMLSAVPLHYMSAINIPKKVIKAIDQRRRAFFWIGEESCHGSKCLVAWDNVQASKNAGGLGVKDLHLQNRCLLMKFINKLFSNEPAAWKEWLLRDTNGFDAPANDLHSYLWKIINEELNSYRSITYLQIRDGSSTSFWFDHWLPSGPICSSHSALFSHAIWPNISVQYVLQNRFEACLRP
jgi:hypothetical protein